MDQWLSDSDGNWDVAGNWSNGLPGDIDVSLTPENATSTNNFTVTFQDGTAIQFSASKRLPTPPSI